MLYELEDWINLAQDKIYLWTLADTIMSLPIPCKVAIYFTISATVLISRQNVLQRFGENLCLVYSSTHSLSAIHLLLSA